MTNCKEVEEFWPELEWIQNHDLREKTAQARLLEMERSPLQRQGLREISFPLEVEGCKVSFLPGKGLLAQLARHSALKIAEFMGDDKPVDPNISIAGALLADVGKLSEPTLADGTCVQPSQGGIPYAA